jgi:hypothetical protein
MLNKLGRFRNETFRYTGAKTNVSAYFCTANVGVYLDKKVVRFPHVNKTQTYIKRSRLSPI